ncbi:rhamnan synthesis F family protein [Lachnospiraceae bacterium 48-21]
MKRCGIFVFFNEKGIVGNYVEELLKKLDEIVEKLIVIVNGEIRNDEKLKLYKYSNTILQRDNIGFDGGAYKDVIVSLLSKGAWEQWDELLLINDTFYGFFFSWNEIFSVMNGRSCDFWGISSHPGGREAFLKGEIVPPHIQSYFILIKKRMLSHYTFYQFWRNLKYPKDYIEAIKNFEINFTVYFDKNGFQWESWLDVQKAKFGINLNQLDAWITQLHFPVLKRKMYKLQSYLSMKKIFQYIDKFTDYPVEVIYEDIYLRSIEGKTRPYNPEQIKRFCKEYEEIFIFGNGIYAKNIEHFLIDNGIFICGNIVSKMDSEIDRVYELEEFEVKPRQGIIVALNEKHLKEVNDSIKKKVPSKQLIIPIYD